MQYSNLKWKLSLNLPNRQIYIIENGNTSGEIELNFDLIERSNYAIVRTNKFPDGVTFNFDNRLERKKYFKIILAAAKEYII